MSSASPDLARETRSPTGLRGLISAFRNAKAVDAAWFVLMALLLGVSPISGAGRPIAAAVLGVVGALFLLGVRLYLHAGEAPRSRDWTLAKPALTVWGLALSAFVLMAPTFVWLHWEYAESIWRNPHGLFVVFFVVLMIRHRLRADSDRSPQASAWGFAFLVPGCALVILDAGTRSHYLAVAGLVLIIPGLSLLLLGTRRTRMLAFPLLFCVFLLPLPDGLSDPLGLPTITSEVGGSIARSIGIPVTRVGTRFLFPGGGGIEVTQNCGGVSSFYSGLALAILCVSTTRSWPRRIALLAAPYLFTAIANGLRVALLLWIASNHGLEWKDQTPVHGILGTLCFLIVLFGVWLLSDRRALRESLS